MSYQPRANLFLTTDVLGGGAAYTWPTSGGYDVSLAKRVHGYVYANQNSAASGLAIQQSHDGTNWDFVSASSVTASTAEDFDVKLIARYLRIVYTNGAVANTVFRFAAYIDHDQAGSL